MAEIHRKRFLGAQKKGKWAEKKAAEWLQKRNYTICYTHQDKASNLPYDILCYKGRDGYALDVKTGKGPTISLKSLGKLMNKKHQEYVKETEDKRIKELKKITKIGYIFVIEHPYRVIMVLVDKYRDRAYRAWDNR